MGINTRGPLKYEAAPQEADTRNKVVIGSQDCRHQRSANSNFADAYLLHVRAYEDNLNSEPSYRRRLGPGVASLESKAAQGVFAGR